MLQCLEFIAKRQNADGSFTSTSVRSSDKQTLSRITVFYTASICLALRNDASPLAQDIKTKAGRFLFQQKNVSGAFNYWPLCAQERKECAYPDDLDDTSLALAALYYTNSKLVDGKMMAQYANLLAHSEQYPGGPYNTWLVDKNYSLVWKNIDIAVNANIAFFLSLQEAVLPPLQLFLEAAVAANNFNSPYYVDAAAVMYFIARAYRGNRAAELGNNIMSELSPIFCQAPTSLQSIFLLNAARYASVDLAVIQCYTQKINAEFLEECFVWQPVVVEQRSGLDMTLSGCEALNAALWVEFLSFYDENKVSATSSIVPQLSEQGREIYESIVKRSQVRFRELGEPLQNIAAQVLQDTLAKDRTFQITLTPYWVAQSFVLESLPALQAVLADLGLASLYGWIAYTIYDDFFDDEGDKDLLALANVCLRELTMIYDKFFAAEPEKISFYNRVMDRLNNAHAWEVLHCRAKKQGNTWSVERLPEYDYFDRLADRSLGHALGAAGLLLYLGYSPASPEVEKIMDFFVHYLIIKQLSDDLHDWEEDVKRGHLSSVVTLVVGCWQQSCDGNFPLQLPQNHLQLQEIFWHKVVEICLQRTDWYLEKAQMVLLDHPLVRDAQGLLDCLAPFQRSVEKIRCERTNTLTFLKNVSVDAG